MKQLIQNFKTGETLLVDVPMPQPWDGQVLIQTRRSLVSLGTERMLVEFSRASLIAKARQQPDKVKQVLEKVRTDGLLPTIEAVARKLDQPIPLGYCNVGTVLAVGMGVTDLRIGDRVVSSGPHAEVVSIPRNLIAPIPATVGDEAAAFTVVGAIGLQGIRLLNPTLGETVVVIGLGLIGLLTADLLRINGCRVIGVDIDEAKCQLAERRGVTVINSALGVDPIQAVLALTDQIGADGVLITAATRTDELISQAARMSRKRGRIVLIGVVGLQLNRADFYEKELSFQVSCSYGPGRHDEAYEQLGHDYPVGYVRWTANRNFQAILQFLERGQLEVKSLCTAVVPLADYASVYNQITRLQSDSLSLTSMLTYPDVVDLSPTLRLRETRYRPGSTTVGIIGAGNFTGSTLLPVLKKAGAAVKIIAGAGGLRAALLAMKFGIPHCTTDYRHILDDPAIDLCIITTRHDSHARLTVAALQAGKHVFVEKPLAIYEDELPAIIEAQQTSERMVCVGFNRRFAPLAQQMKALLGGSRSDEVPMNVVVTINAGFIATDSWVHDRTIGGGRIVGEVGHFIDLITFLTGSRVSSVCLNAMGQHPSETSDSASLLLRYANGASGVVNYFANGSKAYPKERVELYSQGRTLVLDNFCKLTGYGFRGFSSQSARQDKGHAGLTKQLIDQLLTGGESPIPFADALNITQATLAALRSLRENRWVEVASIGQKKPQLDLVNDHD